MFQYTKSHGRLIFRRRFYSEGTAPDRRTWLACQTPGPELDPQTHMKMPGMEASVFNANLERGERQADT